MVQTRVERRKLLDKNTTAVAMLLDSQTFFRLNRKMPGNFYPVNMGSPDLLEFGKSVMENPDSRFTVKTVKRCDWGALADAFRTDETPTPEDFRRVYDGWIDSVWTRRGRVLALLLVDRVAGVELVFDYLGKVEILSEGDVAETVDAFESAFSRYQETVSG